MKTTNKSTCTLPFFHHLNEPFHIAKPGYFEHKGYNIKVKLNTQQHKESQSGKCKKSNPAEIKQNTTFLFHTKRHSKVKLKHTLNRKTEQKNQLLTFSLAL